MLYRSLFLSLLAVALLLPSATHSVRAGEDAPEELVVLLRRTSAAERFRRTYGVRVVEQLPGAAAYRVAVPAGADPARLLQAMQADRNVISADSNFVSLPAEGTEEGQWTTALDGDRGPRAYQGQAGLPLIRFEQARTVANGSGVIVAVLDTGISHRHAALASQLLPGWNFTEGNANTDDAPQSRDTSGNGRPDEAAGHGTFVAGLVARLAPQARLLPVKILDSDGVGTLWSAVQGIRFAVSRGARVINLSFGLPQETDLLREAIREAKRKGAVVVTSAGNHNSDRPQYPAAHAETLAVGAVDLERRKAAFSNYGDNVDVVAPGVDVVSTFWDGRYAIWSGTSFSAAIVSGQVALVLSRNRSLRWDRVVDLIEDTSHSVDAQNPSYEGELGEDGGLVDVDASVAAAGRGRRGGSGSGRD
ncbi:MAG: hypothetical protein FJX77_17505 [Armatimonadetes bacterium]|nr:hypothetical protein [Armatimonadota bacterium]